MKHKVGDVVKVVDNQSSHKFIIGELVTIVEVDCACYKAENGEDFWYLTDDEVEVE